MTNKEKLQITESSIANTRNELRGVVRKLEMLNYHKENKGIASKEELAKINEVEELLREIEFRINDSSF